VVSLEEVAESFGAEFVAERYALVALRSPGGTRRASGRAPRRERTVPEICAAGQFQRGSSPGYAI
jgi:hypothetical protein